MTGGRPTKYRPEFAEQASKVCMLGATTADLADLFDVAISTVSKWLNEIPEFSESVKEGKRVADEIVEKRLFERATGYTHPEEKIFLHEGEVVRADTMKHYPPDSTSAIFWLKNRDPDRWRDIRATEITGKDGEPLRVTLGQGDADL